MLQSIKTRMRRFIANYPQKWVDNFKIRNEFRQKIRKATPVLVYQMGKVGSKSIYNSLAKVYPGIVVHLHLFSETDDDPVRRMLYHWVIEKNNPAKIISITREPIERNISGFFHNFERDTGVPYNKSNFSIAELKEIFLEKFPHEYPLEWFDKHILNLFGIDVYQTEFSANGISYYEKNNVELMVMRVEIGDEQKIQAIKSFLNLNDFQLENSNIGSKKNYSETYKEFKATVKLPQSYVEKMCDSKYFNHFYDQETIKQTRIRWSEN